MSNSAVSFLMKGLVEVSCVISKFYAFSELGRVSLCFLVFFSTIFFVCSTKYTRLSPKIGRSIAVNVSRQLRTYPTPGTRGNTDGVSHHLDLILYITVLYSVSSDRTMTTFFIVLHIANICFTAFKNTRGKANGAAIPTDPQVLNYLFNIHGTKKVISEPNAAFFWHRKTMDVIDKVHRNLASKLLKCEEVFSYNLL